MSDDNNIVHDPLVVEAKALLADMSCTLKRIEGDLCAGPSHITIQRAIDKTNRNLLIGIFILCVLSVSILIFK